MEISTAAGPARVTVDRGGRDGADPAFWLALTHSSNGGVDAPDLLAVRDAALRLGGAVAMVVQPFRAAGRRAPGPADRQDAAWLEVIATLRERCYGDLPLIQGGRSNGARVACRTAVAAGALAVIALAFPLRPPARPDRSRVAELRGAGVPVLVVNGARDPFGVPDPADATCVHVLPREGHDLAKAPAAIGDVAADWLRRWTA
ncbi:MAG TPA: alpha/beta family hydrolase [Streptosporangiaceae bacterium]